MKMESRSSASALPGLPEKTNAPTPRGNEQPRPIALLFATSGHSGVDRVVKNLVAEFGNLPLSFDLLLIRKHGPRLDTIPSNFRVFQFPVSHRNLVLPFLMIYLMKRRPVALLTANHRLNRMALLARKLVRGNFSVAIRIGMSMEGMLTGRSERSVRRTLRSMAFWYGEAQAIITPSAGVAQGLEMHAGVSPAHLRVIPNPIVTKRLKQEALAPVDDPWLSAYATVSIPVILGAGSLEPRKDFETLIQSFARIRKHRMARLIILGEGPSRDKLEALIHRLGLREDVRLAGFVKNPYAYMSRATVFALTSRFEGSGAVIVEAMACGTPAVSTDCPTGPASILRQGRYGPLVPVGDERSLATAIEQLLETPTPPALLEQACIPFDATNAANSYLAALGISPES